MDDHSRAGFTLVELIITMAVLAILIGWALPAFAQLIDNQRLRGAALQLAADLRLARNEALNRRSQQAIGVVFTPGAEWCYGISQQLPCNCRRRQWRAVDACVLDAMHTREIWRQEASAHPGVTLIAARFSGGEQTVFDPVRGLARAGTVTLQSRQGRRLEIRVSLLGRVRICTPVGEARLAGIAAC